MNIIEFKVEEISTEILLLFNRLEFKNNNHLLNEYEKNLLKKCLKKSINDLNFDINIMKIVSLSEVEIGTMNYTNTRFIDMKKIIANIYYNISIDTILFYLNKIKKLLEINLIDSNFIYTKEVILKLKEQNINLFNNQLVEILDLINKRR